MKRVFLIALMEGAMQTFMFYLGLVSLASLPFLYEMLIERIRRE